jgi:hypothetical protein
MFLKDGNVEIVKTKNEISQAIEKLLQERIEIRKMINNNKGCFRKEECEQYLALLKRDEILENILYDIFDIQGHEYLDTKKEYIINVKIE